MTAILVVGPSWVGDMVMAHSLLRTLRDRAPETALDVLAPAWSRALLDRMPEVRTAVELPFTHGDLKLRGRYRMGVMLRSCGYDQAIVLPNSLKSALIPAWAGIPRRTGYLGELRWGLLNDVRRLEPSALPLAVQRFTALAYESEQLLPDVLPRPKLHVRQNDVESALERLGLPFPDGPILALCPGAEYGPAKRWPVENFIEVANAIRNAGWRIWLFGSEHDAVQGAHIAVQVGAGCDDLTGRTTLAEAVDLLSLASAVVSNDSGLMHIAAALGRNLVAIFGSSDPGFTPPLHPGARVLWRELECSPCFARECPLGHLKCLRDITPPQVLDAVAGFNVVAGE